MKTNRCIISGIDPVLLPFEYNEDSPQCQNIKTALLNAIIGHMADGVDEFYTDCSFGFPLWGAEIVTAQMFYHDVRLYVVYPYENQPYKYAEDWRRRFYTVHERCTDVIPMYIEYDKSDTRTFLYDEAALMRKADGFMLADCGRLIFGGCGKGDYIYEQAVNRGYEVTIIEI
jgi:uncharacterized phage-like protein YoqJ